MKATASAPQPLLWVNHDAKNRKARPHRRAVFSHVQSSWKKWRRKEDSLGLMKSAKIPNPRLVETLQPQPRGGSLLELESDNYPREDCKTRDKLRAMGTLVHPQTILGKGNSDPFQAFAISIDAPMADLLRYSKEKYLPEIFSHVQAQDIGGAVTRAFTETITFLHNESTGYPQIAKIAAVIPKGSISPELMSQMPMLKMKGLALLRKKLTKPHLIVDPKTSASMLLFLTAELYEGNLEAVSYHARMIAHLLQTGIIPLDFLFLFSAMYDDTQRASFTLSRPSFDVRTWVPQQLGSAEFTNKVLGQIIADACGPVDVSMKSLSMRAIIMEANHCSAIALLMLASKDRIYTDNQTTFRFGCRRLACIGTIINHYVDSRETMKRSKNDLNTLRYARMEAQICLALLYLMRREAKMDSFWIGAKFAVFSENSNILLSLQDLLRQDGWNGEARYARVELFVLFVGAWAAYANARAGATYALVEKEWFHDKFTAQVQSMRLRSWRAVKKVLLGFHFLELLEPDGSTFWKMMGPSEAQGIETVPTRSE